MSEREVWTIQVAIEGTEAQADEAVTAIARALCPDEMHPGYCPMPWSTLLCRLSDLDEEERAVLEAQFKDQRQMAREVGEPGA